MRQSRYYSYIRNAARTEHLNIYSYKKKNIRIHKHTNDIQEQNVLPAICL